MTTSSMKAPEASLAGAMGRPSPVPTKAERLRKLATVQRRQGIASIQTLTQTRRWVAKASKTNPGLGKFYGVPAGSDVRAKTLAYALFCRANANRAAAQARQIEAAAQDMKWAAE